MDIERFHVFIPEFHVYHATMEVISNRGGHDILILAGHLLGYGVGKSAPLCVEETHVFNGNKAILVFSEEEIPKKILDIEKFKSKIQPKPMFHSHHPVAGLATWQHRLSVNQVYH